MRENLEQFWQAVIANRWLTAAAIIAGSIVAAYVIEFVVRKTLVVLAKKTVTDLDDRLVDILHRPILLSVVLIGLWWALDELNLDPGPVYVVQGIVQTVAILTWAGALFGATGIALEAFSRRSRGSVVQPRTIPIFEMLVRITIVGGAVYFVFLAWDKDVTAWLASAGIVGIAVGFAAKDTLANFFAGIFILADAPYKIGDWIVLDDKLRGRVTRIGVRSTRILTRDDIEITVPNALIGNSKIVNEAGGPYVKQRVAIKVSCAYGSDIDLVRKVLSGVPEGIDGVCAVPTPEVRFRSFGGSGLDFALLIWVNDPAARGTIIDRLNTKVYKDFHAAGIEIPYSKHDLYIKEFPRQSG